MKTSILIWILMLAGTIKAQNLYFPPLVGNTWETRTPQSLGWCTSEIDTLYRYLESRNSKAFIVLKDGRIVMERYFGTFTSDSVWYWASAGKTLTGLLIGIAQQEGHLRISDTTSSYLGQGWTSLPPDKEQKITIWNQLTMTTGLRDNTGDVDCTRPSCLQYAADAGTRWAYHNAPYTLLDTVLQNASGQTLNSYFSQKVRNATGITGLFIKREFNNVFFSRPRSFARFGLLLLNKGKWNNTTVLSDTAYFRQMTTTSQPLNEAYGYLTWLNGSSTFMVPSLQFRFPGMISPAAVPDNFNALGRDGQILSVSPSQNLVIIRMGNTPISGNVPFTLSDTIWQYMNRIMCNTTPVKNELLAAQPSVKLTQHSLQLSSDVHAFQVKLYDLQGRSIKIHETSKGKYLISDNLHPGIYLLKIKDVEGKQLTFRTILESE